MVTAAATGMDEQKRPVVTGWGWRIKAVPGASKAYDYRPSGNAPGLMVIRYVKPEGAAAT